MIEILIVIALLSLNHIVKDISGIDYDSMNIDICIGIGYLIYILL